MPITLYLSNIMNTHYNICIRST